MTFKPEIIDRRTIACENTVRMLEKALAAAKAGEIHGALLFAETDDGMCSYSWTEEMSHRQRLAAIEMLKFQWLLELHTEDE